MDEAIVVKRHIAAPPSKVYRYLTNSDDWSRWQGVGAELNPVPGGVFGITMPNGQLAQGEFVELDPGRRVVFTWGWVGHPALPPGSSTVEIDLQPEDGGTTVTLTHHGVPPDEVAIHRIGWDHYLPRLAIVAQGGDPGPDRGAA